MKTNTDDRTAARKYGFPWSRTEEILALALYKTPGVSPHKKDPEVRKLALLIGRTSDAVALKLANSRAVESGGRSGMSHTASIDRNVWVEFQSQDERLRQEAYRLRKEFYLEPDETRTNKLNEIRTALALA